MLIALKSSVKDDAGVDKLWASCLQLIRTVTPLPKGDRALDETPPNAHAWAAASLDIREPHAGDNLAALLNRGWERVVLSDSSTTTFEEAYLVVEHLLSTLPDDVCRARMAVRLHDVLLPCPETIENQLVRWSKLVGCVVLTAADGMDSAAVNALIEQVLSVSDKLDANGSVPRAELRIVIELQAPNATVSVDNIVRLDGCGIDVMLPEERLSLGGDDQLCIAEAFWATLHADRADGLIPTVVVDPRGQTLGLVYSSLASLREALATGRGVYQSRKRGLWYKGATSGDIQELVRIDTDCDRDALRFTVRQVGKGFCHLGTASCFGELDGLAALDKVLQERVADAPAGSYTSRLLKDPKLLEAKIKEEADELCAATSQQDIAWEAADLIYFALVKCAAANVSLRDVEMQLDARARKVTRRPGNAKPGYLPKETKAGVDSTAQPASSESTYESLQMQYHQYESLNAAEQAALLQRPIIASDDILSKVRPIIDSVRANGDAALIELTEKFDGARLSEVTIRAPFDPTQMQISEATRKAIDEAYENIYKFHAAQTDVDEVLRVETMPGVVCSRFARPIERVGLYVPGGTAVLPSTALMLGVPAKVAGCREIVIASPPRKDGTCVPEVLYVAHKVGASTVVLAGGAQAVAAMAYGTQSVPKVDKICGPGNQFVTAAKMAAQNDSTAMVSIDMPAGPSELLVIADETCTPAYVVADLLSQAEHGPDSQVVLVHVNLSPEKLAAIEQELYTQAFRLPRRQIVWQSIPKSFMLAVPSMQVAFEFSNAYAPEHLILHIENADTYLSSVFNAGSVFVGPYSPESCGDYASGTNHTLPTYGYARMYSGVNTDTFLKHITTQQLTADGLNRLGDTVMQLAEVEGLEAHRNAVAVRLRDIRG